MLDLKKELEQRGFLYQNSSEDVFEKFDAGDQSFFCGFDPTADSLHLGNFIGFMMGVHLMRRNNKYIALVGGATGMIGDPGGKNAERSFLSHEDLIKNEASIYNQISRILKNLRDFSGEDFGFEMVNNFDFFKNMGYLDFLREVGKYVTVNQMISKDTVKKRVEDPDQSISYTEFSYMLLQGYDYFRLYVDKGVSLQIGGQDQWGNLVTGLELIRKKIDGEAYALTFPLLLDSSGKKFGKSEGNALWLDKNKTSPYDLYQYFMNTADVDVERFLKILTLIELDEIQEIVKNHNNAPEKREGQKVLAFKVVEIIHGTREAELAEKITDFMFNGADRMSVLEELSQDEIETFRNAMGGFKYDGENFFEIIVKSGLANSNSEARNAVKSGAISINENKIFDFHYDFSSDFLNNQVLLLQKGKKNFRLIVK